MPPMPSMSTEMKTLAGCWAAAGPPSGAATSARATTTPATRRVITGTSSPPERTRARCTPGSPDVRAFPGANPPPALVEDPEVVALPELVARIWSQQSKHGRPDVEDRIVRRRTRGRHRVGAEQEPVGVLVEHLRHAPDGLWRGHGILGDLV